MRMCSIASGSSGNCIYVGSDNTHLLVDTGISKKRIEQGLKEKNWTGYSLPMNIQTIFRDWACSAANTKSRSMRPRGLYRAS